MRWTVLLLILLVSGCAEQAPETVDAVEPACSIRGLVVDAAIVPLPDVVVTLEATGHNEITDANGEFRFDDVQCGADHIMLSRPGYDDVRVRADAREGTPDVLKIQMTALLQSDRYFEANVFDGFVGYAFYVAGARGTGGLPTQADGDTSEIHFETIPDYFQAESVWSSTQALGESMLLHFIVFPPGAVSTSSPFNQTAGESPIYAGATGDDLEAAGYADDAPLQATMWSHPGDSPVPLSFTFEQRYTMYQHSFYGYTPPAGWRFTDLEDAGP